MKLLFMILFIGFHISLKAQSEEKPFTIVDKMPEFVGGSQEMYRFIINNLQYPDSCKTENIAFVYVQFIVDTSGFIVNPKVVRGENRFCNDEALRVMNLMNDKGAHWSAGMNDGKKVSVIFTLPFKFEPEKK